MLKAAIFDFDGLLLDTETPEFESWSQIFAEQGAHLSLADWTQFVGTWIDGRLHTMLEERTRHPVNHDAIQARHHEIFQRMLTTRDFLPGVRTLIPALRQADVAVAIASNSDVAWVTNHLNTRNFRHHFQVITTGDEVEHLKPAPDLYRLSLERLGVTASEAVVFEDSLPGVQAALTAALTVFAVPNAVTRHITYPAEAHRLNSLADVTVSQLQQMKTTSAS